MTTKTMAKWAGLAIVLILALVFLSRSCRLYDKLSVLKGEHEALQLAYANLDQKSRLTIAQYESEIEVRDKSIAQANETIAKVKDQVKAKDATLLNLEQEFTQLGEDKDAKILNLQAQVSIWKEKFTLVEQVVAKKDAIIFDLTQKYEYQVKISTEWEASYNRQVELHKLCLERITTMEKTWRGIQLGSKVKTYVIAAVGAGLVYSLVKK
jgi:uncharacterized protein (DUF3084 family)